jgi:hypothetical protein
MLFMPGDKVRYTGGKFSDDIGSKLGEVICLVRAEPNTAVVEFGDDSYVMNFSRLSRPSRADLERAEKAAEGAQKKKRRDPDLENA